MNPLNRLEITIVEREGDDGQAGWITVNVNDYDGNYLGPQVTAPIVEGAEFDQRAAAVRQAVEGAIVEARKLNWKGDE